MDIRTVGEFGLIARIKNRIPGLFPQVLRGIGDDAAVSFLSPGMDLVSTVDLLVEGVHFDLSLMTAFQLGRKSLAVNLSDLAAMGARPLFALISFAAPSHTPLEFVDDFFAGFGSIAREFEVSLIGGDTSSSPDRLFLSITLLGEGEREKLVYRRGAREGDDVYVTGTLGDSFLGLYLARSQKGKPLVSGAEFLLERHFNPVPRVKEGRSLARENLATAMIDVSDGLYSDLSHICEESGVGATLWAEKVPRSAPFLSIISDISGGDRNWSLKGGEDYELLFTVPPEKRQRLAEVAKDWPCGVTLVGKITPSSQGIAILDEHGPLDPAVVKGYDHFI